MTTTNDSTQPSSLAKRMIIGGIIGLMTISFFVLPTKGKPEWGNLWMIRPLLVTPIAGALCGLCNHYIMSFHSKFEVTKTVALIASVLVFFVGLWMGIVLGLDGTLWD